MKVALYDINNNLITSLITSIVSNLDVNHITNRLLDGTYHIQTVGDAIKVISVTCHVYKEKKNILDGLFVRCEPIKLLQNGKYHTGLIGDDLKWRISANSTPPLYETTFNIYVKNEEVI